MYPIFGLIGPSGSGKTTFIEEMVRRWPDRLAVVKSLTTRPRRGPEDDLHYDFLTREDMAKREQRGTLLQRAEHAGNIYATDRKDVHALLEKKFGINALVEPAVKDFRNAGCEMILIKLIPINHQTRDGRSEADKQRAQTVLNFDFELTNSFEPGGKEKAVGNLIEFLKKYLD